MHNNNNNLMGLGLFSLSIIHLVSIGKKESFETVEKHIEEADVIEYLYEKYKDHFMVSFDNHIYNNQQLNAYFNSFSGWIEGNEARKCGIIGEKNGLLILLALVTDLISQHEKDWAM